MTRRPLRASGPDAAPGRKPRGPRVGGRARVGSVPAGLPEYEFAALASAGGKITQRKVLFDPARFFVTVLYSTSRLAHARVLEHLGQGRDVLVMTNGTFWDPGGRLTFVQDSSDCRCAEADPRGAAGRGLGGLFRRRLDVERARPARQGLLAIASTS